MRSKIVFFLTVLCLLAILTMGCIGQTKTVPLGSSGPSSGNSPGEGHTSISVDMTSSDRFVKGMVSSQLMHPCVVDVVVDFYNGNSRIESRRLETPTLDYGKTKSFMTNVPTGTTSYTISDVKYTFQGQTQTPYYKVTYSQWE